MFGKADTILEVDSVYKRYARTNEAARRQLSDLFLRAIAGVRATRDTHRDGEFWGLRNISFSVKRGDALGVIGFNGAGKTSLLRVLNGQMAPDRGEVRILGTSASFIDLGAGLNLTLSGRENIYIKGAVLGRSREEMDAVAADIVSFAELGDFIDSPVKNYSSGMTARLGFSIVTHVDPSLLLIDEILSVGDFHFRQKCLQRVRQLRERSSFVLVSHNMRDIRSFCDEVIVLERGSIAFKGAPEDAIEFYQESEARLKGTNQPELIERFRPRLYGHFLERTELIAFDHAYWGRPDGTPVSMFSPGEPVGVHFKFSVDHGPRNLRIGIPVWNEDDVQVTAFASYQGGRIVRPGKNGEVSGFLDLSNAAFNPGEYVAVLSVSDGPEFLLRKPLEPVTVNAAHGAQYWGVTHMDHRWDGLDFK
jgi:ABC-type polysaccharide/polyol phosphate transport system ATPase subunit